MTRHLLKTLWILLLALYCTGFLVAILRSPFLHAQFFILLSLFAAGLAVWGYLTVRLSVFRNRLASFFRLLLAGDYEAGIKVAAHISDEISKLSELTNKAAEQLRVYDTLRAERVGICHRTLEIVHQNAAQGIIIANMEKGQFRLNPAALSLFGMEQGSLSFDTMEKQEGNEQFMTLFYDVTKSEKVPREDLVTIHVPARDLKREVAVRMIPVKDSDEKVKTVLIFITTPE